MKWSLSTSLAPSDASALFVNKSGALTFFQFFSAPSGFWLQSLAIHCSWLCAAQPSALALQLLTERSLPWSSREKDPLITHSTNTLFSSTLMTIVIKYLTVLFNLISPFSIDVSFWWGWDCVYLVGSYITRCNIVIYYYVIVIYY